MKYKVIINGEQDEDIVISARERTELVGRLEGMLAKGEGELYGYLDGDAVRLEVGRVCCFYSEGGRVFAECDEGKLLVKERLYRIEELYSEDFVKINQSCLVNISRIKRFTSSIGGSLGVVLENGYKDYISRRQLRCVKERMGLR